MRSDLIVLATLALAGCATLSPQERHCRAPYEQEYRECVSRRGEQPPIGPNMCFHPSPNALRDIQESYLTCESQRRAAQEQRARNTNLYGHPDGFCAGRREAGYHDCYLLWSHYRRYPAWAPDWWVRLIR